MNNVNNLNVKFPNDSLRTVARRALDKNHALPSYTLVLE